MMSQLFYNLSECDDVETLLSEPQKLMRKATSR